MRSSASRNMIQRGIERRRRRRAAGRLPRVVPARVRGPNGVLEHLRHEWARRRGAPRVSSVLPSSRAMTTSANRPTLSSQPSRRSAPLRTGSRQASSGPGIAATLADGEPSAHAASGSARQLQRHRRGCEARTRTRSSWFRARCGSRSTTSHWVWTERLELPEPPASDAARFHVALRPVGTDGGLSAVPLPVGLRQRGRPRMESKPRSPLCGGPPFLFHQRPVVAGEGNPPACET